jgi:hypothetical protein
MARFLLLIVAVLAFFSLQADARLKGNECEGTFRLARSLGAASHSQLRRSSNTSHFRRVSTPRRLVRSPSLGVEQVRGRFPALQKTRRPRVEHKHIDTHIDNV